MTDWKQTLKDTAIAIGKGLWFLARRLYSLLAILGRFIFLRAVPATWQWLRGTAFPALRRFYRWLPHRRIVTASAAGVVVIAVSVLVIKLLPSDSGNRSAVDEPIRISGREAKLVEKLLSDDWQQQKAATRSVLESVGATVLADDEPLPDDGGLYVIAPELVMLAMDGARKGSSSRLRLAEVAMMLNDFGYPFPKDRHPAASMRDSVQAWVGKSLKDPRTPGAAAARALHAMAAQQRPALDLSSPDWPAEQYALTHLELFVLNTAMAHALTGGASTPASSTASRRVPIDDLIGLVFPAAHAAGPASGCAVTKDLYSSPDVYDANKKTMENVFGLGQGQADAAGGAMGAAAKAANALSTLFKLHKLMLLYSSLDMRVTADKSFVHKPARDEAGKEVVFRTTVGIEEEKYREFVEKMNASPVGKAVKECLASMGLPTPTDMGDIVKEMKNWEVSWDLHGDHATWGQSKNNFKSGNQRREPLEPVSETHAGADFITDIKSEDRHEGDIITGYISGQATLHTDAMPGSDALSSYKAALDTLKDGNALAALLGAAGTTVGLTGSLLGEVIGGWAQRILDPEAYYNVAVAYHQHRYPGYSYEGTVNASAESNYHDVQRHKSKSTDGHSYSSSVATDTKQATASLSATGMRPARMSYTRFTERKDTAYWEMAGPATVAASFNLSYSWVGEHGCATRKGRVHFKHLRKGSGSHSGPATYTMKIEQLGSRDEGYQIHLYGAGINPYIQYEKQTTREERNQGCEFLGAGFSSKDSERVVTNVGIEGFVHSFAVDKPYPKTIAGSKAVENPDGSTTHWSWNFRRIGPIENPTAEAGKVGGS